MKSELKAVPLIRQIRDHQYEELKDMCWEERIAYYKAKALVLHDKLNMLRTQHSASDEK